MKTMFARVALAILLLFSAATLAVAQTPTYGKYPAGNNDYCASLQHDHHFKGTPTLIEGTYGGRGLTTSPCVSPGNIFLGNYVVVNTRDETRVLWVNFYADPNITRKLAIWESAEQPGQPPQDIVVVYDPACDLALSIRAAKPDVEVASYLPQMLAPAAAIARRPGR